MRLNYIIQLQFREINDRISVSGSAENINEFREDMLDSVARIIRTVRENDTFKPYKITKETK